MPVSNVFPPTLLLAKDFALTLSGDLIIGDDGDFMTVTDEDALLQEVIVRLKTKQGDAQYAPTMGASLDTLMGRPNSPDTGYQAEQLVANALTHDGLFDDTEVTVLSMPTSESSIALVISCNTRKFGPSISGQLLSIEITFDLQEGLLL